MKPQEITSNNRLLPYYQVDFQELYHFHNLSGLFFFPFFSCNNQRKAVQKGGQAQLNCTWRFRLYVRGKPPVLGTGQRFSSSHSLCHKPLLSRDACQAQVCTFHNEDKCPLEVSSNCGMRFAMELYCLLIRVTFGQSHYIWNQTRDLEVTAHVCPALLPDMVSRVDSVPFWQFSSSQPDYY